MTVALEELPTRTRVTPEAAAQVGLMAPAHKAARQTPAVETPVPAVVVVQMGVL